METPSYFCGVKQKRTLNELVSPNTVKSETRRQRLEMAEGDQNETSQQTSASEEEKDTMNQTSPSVIEIHDSTNECEEEARPNMVEEKTFVSRLHSFMKDRATPIERIPHLGFKQINLWRIYKAVEKLGGYDSVTARRLWKKVYDELGGSPGSTSAATCTRRHYERLVLPFERHIKGEEDKPLPPSKPRKPYQRNGKVNKAEGKRKRTQSDGEMDSEVLTHSRTGAVCQSEAGMHSLSSPWLSDKHHSDCSQSSRASADLCSTVYPCSDLLQVPTTKPWTPQIPSATGEVISPLEKKKRLAQASLNLPLSPQGEDRERPSVIHCSQSPAPASSTRNCSSSDGSPHPLSSSSSRSPSPLSVSSEDSPTSHQVKPVSSLDLSQNCSDVVKNLPSWSEDRSQTCKQPTAPSKDTSQVKSRSLTAEVTKSQLKNIAWMPIHPGAVPHFTPPFQTLSSYTEKPYWTTTSTSSFTKVVPKSTQLLRPAPIRPGYKVPQTRLTQRDETLSCTKKLNNVSSRLYTTDKWDKSRTMLPRIPPSQQSLSPSNTTLPASCVLSGYDKSTRDTRHQPPFHPGFHPSRMRLPQTPLMYRHLPVSPAHSALVGSAGYPYPYPIPMLSPQTGYTLHTMMPIYPHKL